MNDSNGNSNGNDFDDSLFATAEKRQRHFKAAVGDYCPPIVSEAYHTNALAMHKIPDIFATKLGPNDVQSIIDYLYLQHNFTEALAVCREWLHLNSLREKQLQTNEILDTASRCLKRLGRPEEALDMLQQCSHNKVDLGIDFFIAELQGLNGEIRFVEGFGRYLDSRNNDYMAWKRISESLTLLIERVCSGRSTPQAQCLGQWALAAMNRVRSPSFMISCQFLF